MSARDGGVILPRASTSPWFSGRRSFSQACLMMWIDWRISSIRQR
jgi:hypothetical protein